MTPPTNCPKCDSENFVTLSSGKEICKDCGYSNSPPKPTPSRPTKKGNGSYVNRLPSLTDLNLSDLTSAKIMFIIGFLVMLGGGAMSTTSCGGYSGECVHNIGLLNTRSNIVNIGGFLMLSGAVLSLKKEENKD